MMPLVFSGITLLAAIMTTFVTDLRRAILLLWVAGLGVGCVYLSLGAELLAIIQWIISTLVAISFMFFSVMFGEYGVKDPRSPKRRILAGVLPVLVGGAFAGIITLGGHGQSGLESPQVTPVAGTDVVGVGRALTEQHLLSLEVLAITLFMVLIGSGVIARPEDAEEIELLL